jgi:flavin-dependent dehydrogenase
MPGHTFRWNGTERTNYFGATATGEILGYQVWRARFDRLLLAHARALGATAHMRHTVTGILRDAGGERVTGLLYHGPDREPRSLRARLTIDATGASGILARRLAGRVTETAVPPFLAIWGYWRGAGDPAGHDAFNTYVESFADGWIWTVRVRPDLRNVTVVADLAMARPALRAGGLDRFYREQIAATVATRGFLAGAHLATRLRTCDGSLHCASAIGGPGWLVAGDAASSVDPLTSQGVRKAISSGMTAAVVANTILREPALTAIALDYGLGVEERGYLQLRDAAIRSLIAEERFADRPFWARRSASLLPVPGPEAPPPRRDVLKDAARRAPLQRIRLSWAAGARTEEKPQVIRNILRMRTVVVTAELPAGVEAPGLDLAQLFPIVSRCALLPAVVDNYLAATGRSRDERALVLAGLEALADAGAMDVTIAI